MGGNTIFGNGALKIQNILNIYKPKRKHDVGSEDLLVIRSRNLLMSADEPFIGDGRPQTTRKSYEYHTPFDDLEFDEVFVWVFFNEQVWIKRIRHITLVASRS